MDSTLHALGGILLNGLPTFFIVIFLNFYLKAVFFKPLEQILEKRYQATEGARKSAQDAFSNAERRIAEYQAALRAARAEMYGAQEKLNQQLQEQQTSALEQARKSADAAVRTARAELETEAATARENLSAQSDALANQIADTILIRGQAA